MGLSREMASQLYKERKKEKTQITTGWIVSKALSSSENKNNADLVPVTTVLSCKNPRKRPGKSLFKLLATASFV